MESINDVIGKLQGIKDNLDSAIQAASGTRDDLTEIRDGLGAMGVEDRAQQAGEAAEAVERAQGLIAQAVEAIGEAIGLAAAASGG